MDPSQINKSTPSLVGMSVRQCDDVDNSDYPEVSSSNYHAHGDNGASTTSLNNAHTANGTRPYSKDFLSNKDHFKKSSSFINDSNNEYYYSTVNELDQEGALLTDEYLGTVDTENVVLKPMKSPHEDYNTEESKIALRKRLNLLKRRQSDVQNSVNQLSAASSNVDDLGATNDSDKITNSTYVTPVTSSSHTLATSTDPYQDDVSKPSYPSSSDAAAAASSSSINANSKTAPNGEEQIRNSYGEYILNKSHKPHLARGDSYQSNTSDLASGASTTDLLEHSMSATSLSAGAPGTAADRSTGDRVGRGHHQHVGESSYLRELSRSLSRDPASKKKHAHVNAGGAAAGISFVDDDHSSSSTSVNNYHISKNDMENAINSSTQNHGHAGNHLKNEFGKKQTMNSTTSVSDWKIEEEEEEEDVDNNAADGQAQLDFEKEEGVLMNDQDGGMENKQDMLSS